MISLMLTITLIAATCGAVGGIAYYALCLGSAFSFLSDRKVVESASRDLLPPVSILKPLKGVDPEIYESFRSHCLQDYSQFELVFGVSDPADPAVVAVERLQREFPERAIQLVVCSERLGTNVKVSNLVQMARIARYDHLIVNDSDIRVRPDYLQRVMTPLLDPKAGMVTCLYRGVPSKTLGSRLESAGISTDFAGGVLAARFLEGGVRFGLGSTLAFRRRELEQVGGFPAIVDYLADDYELGKRIAALGLEVCLSEVVVETFLPAYDIRGYFEHQLRWARSVRDSRRWGYVGLLLTFGWPWAMCAVLFSRGASWSWGLLAVAAVLRLAVAIAVGKSVLGDPMLWRLLPLVPMRDLLAVVVWAASFASDTIAWRGDYFRLKDGKLARIS